MNNTQHDTTNMTFDQLVDIVPDQIFAMLQDLKGMRERPDYHPEPSAFIHVQIVTERLMQTGDPDLIMAGLFHDIAKFETMRINPKTGHPTSPGHDKRGAELAVKFGDFVESCGANVENVRVICKQHMRIKQMSQMRQFKQDQIKNLPQFNKLQVFTMADNMLQEFDLTQATNILNQG